MTTNECIEVAKALAEDLFLHEKGPVFINFDNKNKIYCGLKPASVEGSIEKNIRIEAMGDFEKPEVASRMCDMFSAYSRESK